MIAYLMWGMLFGMLFHAMVFYTDQKVVLWEIITVVLAWPIILIIFIFTFINEFRK